MQTSAAAVRTRLRDAQAGLADAGEGFVAALDALQDSARIQHAISDTRQVLDDFKSQALPLAGMEVHIQPHPPTRPAAVSNMLWVALVTESSQQ